ncbi:acyl-CoA dehydrogenase [Anopheles sinensis]|uniref:Acyl-CoA dehydrogenase n=1 Tax=Anopheles sinensis TaxID=74873 RepID=A0A084VR47_ANOSI|nr:acyl-CoA dehydrogenase [Anopheles sinensis]
MSPRRRPTVRISKHFLAQNPTTFTFLRAVVLAETMSSDPVVHRSLPFAHDTIYCAAVSSKFSVQTKAIRADEGKAHRH